MNAAGIRCVVVAPSKLQRPVGDRVKTDAKDAVHLARLLRLDEITAVTVPTVEQKAARDLVRAREDARGDLMRARHRLSKLARVTVKAHHNGALNPKAQYGGSRTLEEVLADVMISAPLTRMMCSPIGDGAAALVLASDRRARSLGANAPVRIRTSVLESGFSPDSRVPAAMRSARLAYEEAGIGPGELDVVELHDAAASSELMRYESLTLCRPGEGAGIRTGATALGGTIPVNPGGGLLARGHPIGATGCAQLVELCDQLRGRAGRRQVAGVRVGLGMR